MRPVGNSGTSWSMDGGRGSSAWPRQLPGTRRGRLMPVKKASEIIVRLGLQRRTTEALEALLDILPALFIQELDSELWRVLRNSLESTKDGSEVAAQVLRLLIEANLRVCCDVSMILISLEDF